MLKGISPLLPPELLAILAAMGHSDTIVLGDANFPGSSIARKSGAYYVRLDGQSMLPFLEAVFSLMPLDAYVDKPVLLMQKEACDAALKLPIIDEYIKQVSIHDPRGEEAVGFLPRKEFYEKAAQAYCVVQTGETALYANLILQKGVIA